MTSFLKKGRIESELLTDPDMILMVEERIKGGGFHLWQRY